MKASESVRMTANVRARCIMANFNGPSGWLSLAILVSPHDDLNGWPASIKVTEHFSSPRSDRL